MREFIFLAVVAMVVVPVLLWSGDASEPVDENAVGAERAEAVARTCAACHGTKGGFETDIPSLAGKPEAVLEAQLLAFKRDEMPGATVMPRLTRGYEDDELRAVARYFASLEAN